MSDSDDEKDEIKAVNANMIGADYFSSDDEEEGAIAHDDPDGPEAEFEDDAASNDTWVSKSVNP